MVYQALIWQTTIYGGFAQKKANLEAWLLARYWMQHGVEKKQTLLWLRLIDFRNMKEKKCIIINLSIASKIEKARHRKMDIVPDQKEY